jgi:putative addiction module component (TIGR02574 family)
MPDMGENHSSSRVTDPEALPLTSPQREELDRRLDELEDEGPTGLSWDEVVAQSRARSR